ncbi:MAG: ATP-binding protein [Azonexus sp.]|nr:ATP-binding protein [Azonexus sp.]
MAADFRLLRIILIDAYCPNRIAELDISNHITINGENGAGKTTLLRLLPMFFGERPSRIIRGDAVTERFGRYYFPSTASYVIFEYQRREHKALAVIHANGQSGDGVDYRFIDSEYKPELFKENGLIVQAKDIFRHVDMQGVHITKPLTLYNYQQIIQNTAGRDLNKLSARFSFIGGTGRLTHLERVVTGILQRATTFHDLKKMIVSSVLSNEESFALRTGKRDLITWVSEYEAHFALMAKAPLMTDLEQADHYRRMAEAGFAKLHARFNLLHDYFDQQVINGEALETAAKQDLSNTETDYKNRLQAISDQRTVAESRTKAARQLLDCLAFRKREYDSSAIAAKVAKVDSLESLIAELDPLAKQLEILEGEVKSLTKVFDDMAIQAKDLAKDQKADLAQASNNIYEASSKRKDELTTAQQQNTAAIRQRHETELETVSARVTELQGEKSGLEVEVRTAQADPAVQETLDIERQKQSDANDALEKLRESAEPLRRSHQNIVRDFEELESQINAGETAIEIAEGELEQLLAADNASEDSLIGFLRRHKPDWPASIGKLVDPETLLRTDLSPMLGHGDDLYGVAIDLEKLKAGRFSSEEAIQQEMKLVRNRLDKRRTEVAEDRKALTKKKDALDKSKVALQKHEADLLVAKSGKKTADDKVVTAQRNVEQSKQREVAAAKEKLATCQANLLKATTAVTEAKAAHRKELTVADNLFSTAIAQIKADETTSLNQIGEQRKVIETNLQKNLAQIDKDRNECLKSNGVSTDVFDGIRGRIKLLEGRISEAKGFRAEVSQYREWLDSSWSQKADKEQEWQSADAEEKRYRRDAQTLMDERAEVLKQKNDAIDAIGKKVDADHKLQIRARNQAQDLSIWPQDPEILEAGLGDTPYVDIDQLINERRTLQESQKEYLDSIRRGVDAIRSQMSSVVGTGPEKFHATALVRLGYPRPGKEHEWLEVFRSWFNDEHVSNRTSLLQQGKTMAQKISAFWNSLNDFKKNVSAFAKQLQSSLEQSTVFESISDVSTDIRAHVDTQDYWEAVGNLHKEYDAWHSQGSQSLPPASFVAAARDVARVINEESGLVADPVDLISLKISANVNNKGSKTASNEHELANMSSNGLSYIILCVVLIGFVNRIRGTEPVVVPFVVDELKDLSFPNAKTLLKLMTQNNITMISAFPDVDLDLAELFDKNYKIQADRKIATISLDSETDMEQNDEEEAHV